MSDLVTQDGLKPTRKVTAATLGAFFGAVVVGAIRRWAPEFDAPGITDLIMAVSSAAVTLAFGWFVKERADVRA
ncbi:hypothetical protein [Aurantimonas coralicida]|uniref:hypothetical protein n=1 Tax=Aurantimonas coralicida TaxID=182270 RepID=UPI001E565068|nr:hypothetical protein [Aurantimonas coralicida]MCD1644172.1 hypothetical protein [Aurantimonas coralicida]